MRRRQTPHPGKRGLGGFKTALRGGAEEDELLWSLAGCDGLPGFTKAQEIFGWNSNRLVKGLDTIEKASRFIEKMQSHPFGLLVCHAGNDSDLDKKLRSFAALARAARRDFGHRTQWFLNIAKASLDYSRFCWRKKKRCSKRLMNTGF